MIYDKTDNEYYQAERHSQQCKLSLPVYHTILYILLYVMDCIAVPSCTMQCYATLYHCWGRCYSAFRESSDTLIFSTIFYVFNANLSRSTFGRVCKLMSSLMGFDKLCPPGFEDFLPSFSTGPLRLCQIGLAPLVVPPVMFCWVQVRPLAG